MTNDIYWMFLLRDILDLKLVLYIQCQLLVLSIITSVIIKFHHHFSNMFIEF